MCRTTSCMLKISQSVHYLHTHTNACARACTHTHTHTHTHTQSLFWPGPLCPKMSVCKTISCVLKIRQAVHYLYITHVCTRVPHSQAVYHLHIILPTPSHTHTYTCSLLRPSSVCVPTASVKVSKCANLQWNLLFF